MTHEAPAGRPPTGAGRICLVTTSHIAHNPRIVKEADTLHEAGYHVRVVSCQANLQLALRDEQLMATRSWELDPVVCTPARPSGAWRYRWALLRNRLFKGMAGCLTLRYGVAEHALCLIYPELLRQACRQAAHLFIAHNPGALPAARAAARRWRARLAFDSEDFHTGEFQPAERHTLRFRLIERIETKYLRSCDYVSAPSALIADALAQQYGIERPVVIHNVFPWRDRAALDGQIRDRRGPGLSLYWYSQTIGLDRGIQDAIRALGLLDGAGQLHLRGTVSEGVKGELTALARGCGVAGQIHFHDTVPPTELLSRTAEHDVGLALEQCHSFNYASTLTNKIFFYMLAGLTVAATDVPGQRSLMQQCLEAGVLYRPGDHRELATQLARWLQCRERLQRNKQAALAAAAERWNWETECRLLLNRVGELMP